MFVACHKPKIKGYKLFSFYNCLIDTNLKERVRLTNQFQPDEPLIKAFVESPFTSLFNTTAIKLCNRDSSKPVDANTNFLKSSIPRSISSYYSELDKTYPDNDYPKAAVLDDFNRKDKKSLSNNQTFSQENLEKSNNMTIFQYLKSKMMKNSIIEDEREFWQDNAFSFEGVFDLEDNSYSMKTLNSYLKSKGKRTI